MERKNQWLLELLVGQYKWDISSIQVIFYVGKRNIKFIINFFILFTEVLSALNK